MTTIFEKLFDTYGESIMREHALYEEAEVMEALDKLPMDRSTKVAVSNLLFAYYFRWSTAAFSIGLHLGLSLLGEQNPPPRKA